MYEIISDTWDWIRDWIRENWANLLRFIIGVFFILTGSWGLYLGFSGHNLGDSTIAQLTSFILINVGPEFAGIAVGILVIDYLGDKRHEQQLKRQYFREIRSGNKERAQVAIDELKTRGKNPPLDSWLTDGSMRRIYLVRASLDKINLQTANLQEGNLIGVSLREAVLSNTNLQKAVIVHADLEGAYLMSANLRGASLGHANLKRANLNRADLRKANFLNSNLRETDLRRANFLGAHFENTDFRGAIYNDLTIWPDGFKPKANMSRE